MEYATPLQLIQYLCSRRKIDNDMMAAATRLLRQNWNEELLDWITVNFMDTPAFENTEEMLLRAVAEIAMRMVIAFSFSIEDADHLNALKA